MNEQPGNANEPPEHRPPGDEPPGEHHFERDPDPDRPGRRPGPIRFGPFGPGSRRGFGRGPAGGSRSRARRGAVGRSILLLLSEQPMHGYEMIAALDERSGRAWKPSAGSMYPALERLNDKGLIEPVASSDDDKQRYQLTTLGRRRVAEMTDAGIAAPWAEVAASRGGDLRSAGAVLMSSLRQIGRFGSPAEVDAAKKIIADANAQLHRLLADGDRSVGERDVDDQLDSDDG